MNLAVFVWVATKYKYKDVPHQTKRHVGGARLKPPRGPVPPWAQAREMPGFAERHQVGSRVPEP